MADWAKIRKDFPIVSNCVYLMSAAMSPLPRQVFERLTREYRKLLEDGDVHWTEDMGLYKSLCAELSGMIHGGAEDVTFGPNTSTLMGLLGLSFQKHGPAGFNIVTLQDEFPASTVPFEHLGIPLRCVQPEAGRYTASRILDEADERTLAVVVSYVQYATGFRMALSPLGRELKKRGVALVVNATQGFPFFPIDVRAMGIDALTASLHKWGLAGHVGSLFYTSPAFRERFPSVLAGWLSIDTGEGEGMHTAKNVPFRTYASARQYEFGTFNLQPLLGLHEALGYLKAIGFEEIRRRLMTLADRLVEGLRRLEIPLATPVEHAEERSAIICMTLGEKNKACFKRLLEERIYLSLRAGYLRAALNLFNDESDIARLLDVLEDFKKRG